MIATLSRIRTRTGRIGLEFDGGGLRCAQVRRSGTGWRLVRSRCVATNLDDPAEDQPAFAATDLLLATAGFTGADLATVLPMNSCELRVLEVPRGTRSELREMVTCEMEEGSDANSIVDFWQLPDDASSRPELTSLCALAADKPAIATAASTIQTAGYNIVGIDSLPTACARAAELWRNSVDSFTPPSGSVLSIHIGWERCTLTVSSGGPPEITRVPQIPGLRAWLVEAGHCVGTDPQDMLRIVQGLHDGLLLRPTTRLLQKLSEFTAAWSQQVCLEILRTLSFARRPGTRSIPAFALLMGGGAVLPGLVDCVEAELNIDTRLWTLPCDTRCRGGAEFAVAAALSAWEIAG